MTNKILVTGADGLVGSRFVDLYSAPQNLLTPNLSQFDLTDPDLVHQYLYLNRPTAVLHLAAWTDVSAAEKQRGNTEGLCWRTNVDATRQLFQICQELSIYFLFMSTDMVFSGSLDHPGPYSESALPETDPRLLNWYGQSKLAAEKLVLEGGGSVVRICNPVRAKFPGKLDFLRKSLSLFDQHKLYPLFSDQRISLSFIDEVSQSLEAIIADRLPGVFHISSSDVTSPYEVVSYFIERLRGSSARSQIQSSTLSGLDNPSRYPKYGGLSSLETQVKLQMKFRSWKEIVDALIRQGVEV